MYIFVRLPDMPFDGSNVFNLFVWIVTTFGPIAELLINFVFTPWRDNFGNVYSLASILLSPVTLGLLWAGQALKAVFN